MDTLPAWILRTVDSERYGGRTIRTDERTVVLYDCGTWTTAHARAVRARYPECDIAVTHSPASLSGFVVIFTLTRDRSLYRWTIATAGVILLLLVTFRQVLSAPV